MTASQDLPGPAAPGPALPRPVLTWGPPGPDGEGRNLLVHADNLDAIAALRSRFTGRLDFVYIDPPFDSRRGYSARTTMGGGTGPAHATPITTITQATYDDTWTGGLAGYLSMMKPRLAAIAGLLAPTGLLCVHVDHRTSHHVRLLLDNIIGSERFVNEIIWRYGKMSNASKRFAAAHDTLLVYSVSDRYYFKPLRTEASEYRARYERHLVNNKVCYGSVASSTDKLILRRIAKIGSELGRPLEPDDVLFDFDTEFKAQDDVFYDISIVKGNARENAAFDTQKPLGLLTRLIEAFCPPGGLVADFFLGSGTTAVAAQQRGRRWIGVDAGALAIQTAYRRLRDLPATDAAPGALIDLTGQPSQAQVATGLTTAGLAVTLELRDYLPGPSAPAAVTAAARHWSDHLDSWHADFGDGSAPHDARRTDRSHRSSPRYLPITATHTYAGPGTYLIDLLTYDVTGIRTTVRIPVTVS